MSEERYRVCKFVLLAVCLAAALFIAWHTSRYHYSPAPVEGRFGRVDRFTGNIEVYLLERGWVDVRDKDVRDKDVRNK
jgi:hypothetical protein